jgi:hypothetical protein
MGIMKSEELSALLFKKNKMKDKTKAKKRHRKKGKQIRLDGPDNKNSGREGKKGKKGKEKSSLLQSISMGIESPY